MVIFGGDKISCRHLISYSFVNHKGRKRKEIMRCGHCSPVFKYFFFSNNGGVTRRNEEGSNNRKGKSFSGEGEFRRSFTNKLIQIYLAILLSQNLDVFVYLLACLHFKHLNVSNPFKSFQMKYHIITL